MPRKGLTVQKVREVLRLIGLGQTDRQIARSLSMRRSRVAEIRRTGERSPETLVPKAEEKEPEWAKGLVWAEIVEDLKNGYEMYLLSPPLVHKKSRGIFSVSPHWTRAETSSMIGAHKILRPHRSRIRTHE